MISDTTLNNLRVGDKLYFIDITKLHTVIVTKIEVFTQYQGGASFMVTMQDEDGSTLSRPITYLSAYLSESVEEAVKEKVKHFEMKVKHAESEVSNWKRKIDKVLKHLEET